MKVRHTLALAALAISAAGCASSSSFRSTWKNPEAEPVSLTGKRVLAVVQIRDEARRRTGEDLLAAEITKRGGQGVASYTLFPSSGREQNEAEAEARAKEKGFSGMVIMRFLGREKTVTREPNPDAYWRNDPYYRRPWGAWGRGWSTMYEPTVVRTDIAVIVETRVYSLEQQKLLWTGTSATVNPDNSTDVVKDLSTAVARQLEKSGVLPKP
jgi:hypothetical protein